MIYGVGTDVVEVSRIAKALERFGDDFAKKILSPEEFLVFQKNNLKENFLAKRFAAKEAFSKAIGTGFRDNLNFKDINITNDKLGKPSFVVTDKIKKIIKKQFKISSFDFFLSISDEKKYSIAYVILQKK